MASLATPFCCCPNTWNHQGSLGMLIKGLRGCSISGTKLHVKPSRQGLRTKTIRSGAVVAKYGDKSVYFDLGNGTCMDLMLPLHTIPCSKFFETFAAPFTKRRLLLKFLILGWRLVPGVLPLHGHGRHPSYQIGTSAPTEVGATWQDLISSCPATSVFSGICLCMYHVEFLWFNSVVIANNKP